MIKIFDATLRLFFFPVKWANAVTTWIQNVSSPDDSIKVRNTCSPKEGDSLKLTVNMNHIYDGVKAFFAGVFVTFDQLREHLDDACDHNSIEVNEGQFRVSEDWLAKQIGGGDEQAFDVQAVMKTVSGQQVIDYLRVYLPTLAVKVWNEDYNVETGSATGTVAAISGEMGWYKINGITAATLYLNDASILVGTTYTRKMRFGTAALSSKKYSAKFATVTSEGDVTLYYATRMPSVNLCDIGAQERPETYNENFEENEGGSDSPHADYPLDTREWVRGTTQTLTYSPTGNDTLTSTENNGIRCQVMTRTVRIGTSGDYMYWRYWYFDKNGALYKIGPEQGCYREKHQT